MAHIDRPARIPLFPLDVVLLPGMPLPLHIFEPRYKLMIRRCLQEKIQFGMILAANQSVASIGCTAEIIRKIHEYDDGRMDILTEGRAVFRLEAVLDEKEYYEGRVAYLTDGPHLRDEEKESKLLAEFSECHLLLTGRPWPGASDEELPNLAYHFAAQLPVDLETRQSLLESRSEGERRDLLLGWVADFLPKLRDRHRMERNASGNGRAYLN
jgi:Lon protease-like protein